MASNAENVSIWWRHHEFVLYEDLQHMLYIYIYVCVCVHNLNGINTLVMYHMAHSMFSRIFKQIIAYCGCGRRIHWLIIASVPSGLFHIYFLRNPMISMMTSSNGHVFALLTRAGNTPVTGEFPSQTPVTRSFDAFFICAFFYLRLE